MEIVCRHVEYRHLRELEATHPVLSRLTRSEEHFPSMLQHLHTCPDIYEDFPCFFYLQSGGDIVASIAALPDNLTVGGRLLRWAWMGSLFTSPNYRRQGLGGNIWRAALETFHEAGIIMGAAYLHPAVTEISRGMGFTISDRARRLVFLKTARPFLSHHLKGNVAIAFLDAPYRLIARGARVLALWKARDGHGVQPEILTGLGAIENRIGQHTAPHYDEEYAFNDSTEKFAWKLDQCRSPEVHAILDSAKNVLVRFVVKNRNISTAFGGKYRGFRLMTLMDYVLFEKSESNYKKLADALIRRFWESDAQVLETVSSSQFLNNILIQRLMIPAGKGVSFVFKTHPRLVLPGFQIGQRPVPGAAQCRPRAQSHQVNPRFLQRSRHLFLNSSGVSP